MCVIVMYWQPVQDVRHFSPEVAGIDPQQPPYPAQDTVEKEWIHVCLHKRLPENRK